MPTDPAAGEPATSESRGANWRFWISAVLLGVAIAGLSVALFGVSGRDDPYITFSAAEAIKDSGALVNINGDPVEQSTTLLFTLLLVLLSSVSGLPIPELGWLLGLVFLAALPPMALAVLRETLGPGRALAGAGLVGATPPIVYWGASGAEQTLGVVLVLGSLLAISKLSAPTRSLPVTAMAAALTALTFLTRPDLGLAIVAATALLAIGRFLVGRSREGRALTVLLVMQILLLTVITVTRLAVTGSVVPQPLMAKVGGQLVEQGLRGMDYLSGNAASPWFVAVLAMGIVGAWTTRRRPWNALQVLLLMTAVVLITGFVVSGGDWMELGRFFATPAILLGLLAVGLLERLPRRAFATTIGVLALIQMITLLTWSLQPETYGSRGSSLISRWQLSTVGSPGVPAKLDVPLNRWNADHLGDAYFLGAAIPAVRKLIAGEPERTFTVTSGQGGMVPYFLREAFGSRLRFIDRFQLMTTDFEDCELTPGPYGAFVSWTTWERLSGSCAPDLPDLVYSIGPLPEDELGTDYIVVVHVTGTADRGDDSLRQDQWLAVRSDLLPSR